MSQGCNKAKTSVPNSPQSLACVWMTFFCVLFWLVGQMNLIFMLSDLISGQEREMSSSDLVDNNTTTTNFHWHSCIYWLILLKFGVIIDTTKPYNWKPVWMTLTSIERSQLYEKETPVFILCEYGSRLGWNWYLSKLVWWYQQTCLNSTFDTNVNGFGLSRSQVNKKDGNCAAILLENGSK